MDYAFTEGASWRCAARSWGEVLRFIIGNDALVMKQILTFVVSTYGARHPWGPNFLRCLTQYWESQMSTWWVNRFYDRFCFSLVLRDFLLWQGGLQGIQLLKHLDGINWDCDDKTWLNFNHVRISRITLSCEILGSDERNSLILTDGLHCRLWAIRGIKI